MLDKLASLGINIMWIVIKGIVFKTILTTRKSYQKSPLFKHYKAKTKNNKS